MDCLICRQPAGFAFTIDGYEIFECLDCKHRMTSPKNPTKHVSSTYSDHYFFNGGAGYRNYLEQENFLIQHGRRYGEILSKYVARPGKLLDVGAAADFIMKGLRDFSWECRGIEPNELLAQFGRNRFGFNIHTGTIESFKTSERFDLICFIQVIAHLIDPKRTLEVSLNVISSHGFILVETWNYRSWIASLFGKRWHEYSPLQVLFIGLPLKA